MANSNYPPNNSENGGDANPQAEQWDNLSDDVPFRGTLVKGPDGKMIPKEQLDAAMEAHERAEFYKNNPGAAEHEALIARLGEMEANPDRLDNFEGENNIRGAADRNSEYTTLNGGENGMYAGKIDNATRQKMTRMMHDAEDFQTFEESGQYDDYIARERAKIGTVYKDQDDFNHKIVARLKQLESRQRGGNDEVTDYFEDIDDPEDDAAKQAEFQPPVPVEQPPAEDDFQPPAIIEEPQEQPDFQPPAVVEEQEPDEPITAVNIHREHDAKIAAMKIARERLNKELQDAKQKGGVRGLLTQIWKGTIAREYYTYKKADEVYSQIQAKQAGEETDITDAEWNAFNQDTINRMVDASVEGYEGLLHARAGEQFYEENAEATQRAKEIIAEYANGSISTEEEFNAKMQEVRNMLGGENVKDGKSIIQDNYLEIANTVKTKVEHGKRLEDVLEGFRVLNAEGRTGVRTREHEEAIDNILEKVSNSRFNFIPDAAIVAGVGIGMSIAKSAGSRAATYLVPVGGLLLGSAWAAAKEKGRVERDRIQRTQEMAMGQEDAGNTKYDQEMAGTIYAMYDSSALLDKLNSSRESGNTSDIIESISRIETIIAATDSGLEHIKYSNPDKIEEERYALDKALAEARLQLKQNPEDWQLYTDSRDAIYQATHEDLEANESAADKAFNKLRAKRMAIQAGKTLAIGAVTMIGTQEVIAAFDPKQYGVLDEAFNLTNDADAKQTLLARALGFEPKVTVFSTIPEISQSDVALSEQEIKELEEQGMVVNKSRVETNIERETIQMDASEAAEAEGIPVSRDWAANGTHQPDGNELRVYYNQDRDGLVTGFQGNSTTWAHGEVNPTGAIAEGKVRMMVTLQEGTNPIPVDGTILPNGQMQFIPEPGSAAAAAFKDGVFVGRYAEIGEVGSIVNGKTEFISYATLVGNGVSGPIDVVSEVATETQLYNIIREVETSEVVRNAAAEMTLGGIPIPFVRRRNLTYGEPAAATPPGDNNEFQPPAVIEQPATGGQPTPETPPSGEAPIPLPGPVETPAGEGPTEQPTGESPEGSQAEEGQQGERQERGNTINIDQYLFDRNGLSLDNILSPDYATHMSEFPKLQQVLNQQPRLRSRLQDRLKELNRGFYSEYLTWVKDNHPDNQANRQAA